MSAMVVGRRNDLEVLKSVVVLPAVYVVNVVPGRNVNAGVVKHHPVLENMSVTRGQRMIGTEDPDVPARHPA